MSRIRSVLLLATVAAFGCSPDVRRYEISGSVLYDGKPVPGGTITFEPDPTRGGTGPGAMVRILDGRYRTEPKHGVVGGPHILRVVGYSLDLDTRGDSGVGKEMFPETTLNVDLPQGGEFDVVVPVGGPKK